MKTKLPVIKNCNTCANRQGRGVYARCLFAGLYCDIARHNRCGRNWSGWQQRQSPLQRLFNLFLYR